ncbi:hypothetical protein Daesc_005342 [Daldinia eschscholtzii]|uniref:Uncharacterized protein n=1 Tax=Daldinia eschscholtzii TaxID=292717 RepID=A0AAX6MKM5_9PEZI
MPEGLQKAQSQYKTRREESQTLKRCRKCPKPLAPGDKSFCVDHTKTQKVTDGKQQRKKRTERKAAAETNGRLDQPSSGTQETGQDVSSGMGFEDYMSMALATSPAHDSASYYAPSTEPWMLPENPAQGLESTSNPYLSNAHTSSSLYGESYGEPYDQVTQGFFADAMYMHDVYGDTLDGGVVQQSSDYSTQVDFEASGMDNIPFDYDNSNLPGWYTQPSNPPGY